MLKNLLSKKNRYYLLGFLILLIALIVILIKSYPEIKAKKNVTKVTTIMLDFPDAGANAFYSDPTATGSDTMENVPKIAESIKTSIPPYFTKNGFDAALSHWYTFGSFCAGTDWTAKVEHIIISSLDSSNNTLRFTFDLRCKNSQKKTQLLYLSGKAQFNSSGILNYWVLSDDSIAELAMYNEQFQAETN